MQANHSNLGSKVLLVILGLSLGLAAAEILLRFAFPGLESSLFAKSISENFFCHHLRHPPAGQPPPNFDPRFGWIDFSEKRNQDGTLLEPTNPTDTWRVPTQVGPKGNRRRVILLGDSFIYGWEVRPDEIVARQLSNLLGPEYEVFDLATRGYGIDQMALVAREVVPRYDADIVVFAFSPWDLDRACFPFDFGFRKPRFSARQDGLVLEGVPIQTPYETYQAHRAWKMRLLDGFLVQLNRSKTFRLIAEAAFRPEYDRRIQTLCPLIFQWVCDKPAIAGNVLFVQLDGDTLPQGFEERLRSLSIPLIQLPPILATLSKQSGHRIERRPDGHPGAGLNGIYAYAIFQEIKKIHKKSDSVSREHMKNALVSNLTSLESPA